MSNRLLFVTPSFRNGGTTSCLKSLVPFLVKNGYDLSLLPLSQEGPNRDYLSNYCHILSFTSNNDTKNIAGDGLLIKVARRAKHLFSCIGIDISKRGFMPIVNRLKKESFDYIIAFQEETASYFVSLFGTNNLIGWVHCDYSRVINSRNFKRENSVYGSFKNIVFVSNYTRDRFVEQMPAFATKTQVIHNFIDYNKIRSLSIASSKSIIPPSGKTIIVSMGRLDPVKRFTSIPKIYNDIASDGVDVIWYIIGGGNKEEEIRIKEEIKRKRYEDRIVMTGNLDNPFPLMKLAKYYVCTSVSEAYPNVVREALALGIPSIVTDFGSSKEVVEDSVTGIICPLESIARNIVHLEKNPQEYDRLRNNCLSASNENDVISKQLLSLFDRKEQ